MNPRFCYKTHAMLDWVTGDQEATLNLNTD